MSEKLEQRLIQNEGKIPYAYQDSLGFWTIGIGICIDKSKGGYLSEEEMLYLLQNRLNKIRASLSNYIWFRNLSEVRQEVLIEMAYNLGVNGLLAFKKMISFIEKRDYENAVKEMRSSKWAMQIGKNRLDDLCKRISTGRYD